MALKESVRPRRGVVARWLGTTEDGEAAPITRTAPGAPASTSARNRDGFHTRLPS
jgi:hypothetical protein